MNISAPFRNSQLRSSTYDLNLNYNPHLDPSSLTDIEKLSPPSDSQQKRQTFWPVQYAESKAACDAARIAATERPESIFLASEEDAQPSGFGNRIWCMATVYPYRDMNWLVAVIYTLGSFVFVINGFFTFLPVVAPSTAFENESTTAFTATIDIATGAFLFGGVMALFAAFNNTRRETGNVSAIKEENKQVQKYQPTLLGTKQWIWFPTLSELRTIYLPNPAFKAGLLQLIGGLVFSISAVAGFPGVINSTNPENKIFTRALVDFPLVLGGVHFLIAGTILMVIRQGKWYIPNVRDGNWQGAFWFSSGALCFVIAGALMIWAPANVFGSGLASLTGSWAFLIGTFLQWYVLMEEYPNRGIIWD